eukprot:scaffold5777_cov66-Attheya_sp.AAC.2
MYYLTDEASEANKAAEDDAIDDEEEARIEAFEVSHNQFIVEMYFPTGPRAESLLRMKRSIEVQGMSGCGQKEEKFLVSILRQESEGQGTGELWKRK